MPTVKLGQTNKRVNSTSKAFAGSASSFSCTLREKCGLYNPVFILESQTFGNKYNYAEFEGLYYWIDDIISFPRNIIEVHCHLDPLASYQQDIFDTYAFMSFNSLLRNTEIDDPRLNPELIEEQTVIISDIFDSNPSALSSGGTVILTVFECGDNPSDQGVKVYAISYADFCDLLIDLQSSMYDSTWNVSNTNTRINNNLSNYTTPSDDANMIGAAGSVIAYSLYKGLTDVVSNIGGVGSWRDNLIRALYVPIPISEYGSTGKTIFLGYLACRKQGIIIPPAKVKTKTTNTTIAWGSKASQYHFIKHNKYAKMQAICAGGQFVDINTDLIRDLNSTNLYCHSAIDICSGDWSAVLTDGSTTNSIRLAAFGGNLGIDITGLAGRGGYGAGMNYTLGGLKLAGNILSMGLANSVSSAPGERAASIGSGVAAQFIQNSVGGTGTGVAGTGISSLYLNGSTGFNDIAITTKIFYPSILDGTGAGSYDSYGQRYGFPCNQYGKLGSYTGGFVKCEGASCAASAPQEALAYINATMNSGIYIEN